MNRVLVIIIDAMDSVQLSKHEAELPNLRRLKKVSPELKLTSVYPPDSPTALSSIYTGLNPAKHGVVHFVDPLVRASIMGSRDFDNTALRGKTFWDIAGREGKKVCAFLPYLGYPSWPVNGMMVSRSSIRDDVQMLPADLSHQYDLSSLIAVKGFPGRKRDFPRYLQKQEALVLAELDLALKLLADGNWDLFIFYSGAIDAIAHPFWRFCDENDPSYPGPNPYQNVIRDFYVLYDRVIGELLAAVSPGTPVLILSDHGHGMRPVKLLNINQFLRQKGLLFPRATNPASKKMVGIIERVKRSALNIISKRGLGNAAAKLLRIMPLAKRVYTSPLSIDWGKTVACASDLSGIKAYPYGGIRIARHNLDGRDYEELRDLIIREVQEIRGPAGSQLVSWVRRREELYWGDNLAKYPDVVLELKDDWGIGWAVDGSLFGTSPSHNLVPGSHKLHSPVFFLANLGGREVVKKDIELMDVAPTVLDLLGVAGELEFDGRSLLRS